MLCRAKWWEGFGHEDAQVVCVRAPVTRADLLVAPGAVHGDERDRGRGGVECHDTAALAVGTLKRKVVDEPAITPAFVGWIDRELTEGPSCWVSEQRNLGLRVGSAEGNGCDWLPVQLTDEAYSAQEALGSVLRGLVSGPVAEAFCSKGRIGRTNQRRQRFQVLRGGDFADSELAKDGVHAA